MRFLILLLMTLLVSSSGCRQHPVDPVPDSGICRYSFETDMEGWVPHAADVSTPPVEWSIQRTQERAWQGQTSLRVTLDNMTDAGKLWIEHSFAVQPGRQCSIEVSFRFATRDYGVINSWRLIARAGKSTAAAPADLIYQDETSHGGGNDVGFIWTLRTYSFLVESGEDGKIFVDVGIWGTWESLRTYYLDDITVRIVENR